MISEETCFRVKGVTKRFDTISDAVTAGVALFLGWDGREDGESAIVMPMARKIVADPDGLIDILSALAKPGAVRPIFDTSKIVAAEDAQ